MKIEIKLEELKSGVPKLGYSLSFRIYHSQHF